VWKVIKFKQKDVYECVVCMYPPLFLVVKFEFGCVSVSGGEWRRRKKNWVCANGYGEEWGMMRVSKNWILKKEERERESKRKRRLAAEDTNITVTKKE